MDRWIERLTGSRAVALVTVVVFAAVALGEQDLLSTLFVAAVASLLATLLLLITARPRFAVVATLVLLVGLTFASAAKMKFMGLSLHAFDVFFYLRDVSVAEFLAGEYLLPVAVFTVELVAGVLVAGLVFRFDRPRRGLRRIAAVALLPLVAAMVLAYPRQTQDRLDSYYFGYHLTSSFFVSLADIGSLLTEPDFVDRLKRVKEHAAYAEAGGCEGAGRRPDIVVALMESAFPPEIYPSLKSPPGLDAAFRSADGRTRSLEVETFGGGTWISTVGLFTGLPTTEFDWMRPYLPYYLHGRVHHSLIRALERCGYDTMVVSPLAYRFVDEGPFLTSLGFRTYLDWKAIGAASKHERDSVYFDAVLDRLKRHRAADARPLFVFVMTMSTHSPFARRFAPDERLAGEPWGNTPEIDEYLRRSVLQQRDFDAFAAALAADPGRNGTVLVDFGDHQPIVTRSLAEAATPAALDDWGSIAYRTYYRIAGLGRPLARPLPEVDRLGISFLGTTILEAAGLPLDPVHRELASLRDRCDGRVEGCADRARLDRHLRMLVNAGMLDLGTTTR